MKRELHVRFREGPGVQFPRATRLVVMCRTKKDCEQTEKRIRVILERLGLELHPDKTRRVELYDGKEGFDFLGCHLHKRMSGIVWERRRERLYFLHRWPSQRSMQRIRQRVKELTLRGRCHQDIRVVIADLNPVLRVGAITSARATPPSASISWMTTSWTGFAPCAKSLRGTVRYPEPSFWQKGAA